MHIHGDFYFRVFEARLGRSPGATHFQFIVQVEVRHRLLTPVHNTHILDVHDVRRTTQAGAIGSYFNWGRASAQACSSGPSAYMYLSSSKWDIRNGKFCEGSGPYLGDLGTWQIPPPPPANYSFVCCLCSVVLGEMIFIYPIQFSVSTCPR